MFPAWRKELSRLIILMASAGFVGYWFNQSLAAILLITIAYLGFTFYQIKRIHLWLIQDHSNSEANPPESIGLWGNVFDGIYHLQRRERQASAILKNIIEKAQESSAAMEMAVVMINSKNSLDWWNTAAENLLGFKDPQDRGRAISNLLRDPEFLDYYNNEEFSEPLKLPSPKSADQILEFSLTHFGQGEKLLLARNITHLHRLELMRKDFVANVSHELRTPITVIKGYLEAIVDNSEDLDEKWRKPISQMQQQSARMENIVKDLLLLSSLETSNITTSQSDVRVRELLEEVLNDTAQSQRKKGHHYRIECNSEDTIHVEHTEFYSAVLNLVVNAAKYTTKGGEIILSGYNSDAGYKISIEDNGLGIEAQHLPRLTERFYRVDASRSSDTGGTGLGLAIVKHILARHGGSLEVTSETGEGSCFSCVLPESRVVRPHLEGGETGPEAEPQTNQ